ncbi:MAG: tetratricopeptide repeat protein [Breznakibacter sp.]
MRFVVPYSPLSLILLSAFLGLQPALMAAYSQNRQLTKADELYAGFDYPVAIKKYLNVNKKGISPYYTATQIAHSHRMMGQPDKAETWYKKALQYSDVQNSTFFYLGQVLYQQQKNEEAIPYLNRYFQNKGYTFGALTNNLPTLINYLKRDSNRYEIRPMPFNTEFSEMGPALTGRYIYYSSNRPERSFAQWADVRNNKTFYRVFKHDTIMGLPDEQAEAAFRTPYNNGPIFFTRDGNAAFITRNVHSRKESADLHIVISVLKNGEWSTEVSKLPMKDDGYSIFHASLTPDGKRLFFASNRPGGYGGIDLYYSDMKGGFWTKPINLGPNVNTPGNEVFPFVGTDGTLFFASDGHPGLGGLDIFSTPVTENDFGIPINMGASLNSSFDDFGLVLKPDQQSGYFTSNRAGGKGDDDIYEVRFTAMAALVTISGQTLLPDRTPINNVQITILDEVGTLFNQLESDENGKFNILLPNNSTFTILFRKKLFQNKEIILQPSDLRTKTKEIEVEMIRR